MILDAVGVLLELETRPPAPDDESRTQNQISLEPFFGATFNYGEYLMSSCPDRFRNAREKNIPRLMDGPAAAGSPPPESKWLKVGC